MPSVKIEKNSNLTPNESFQRISNLLENDADLRKLDPKLSCKFDSKALSGQAEGSHFKAKMQISQSGGGSKIEVTVDLPFHLALVKGMVEKTLAKKIDETLA